MNAATASLRIALVGNPNCGKTALFNRLTGNRQKVANYAGVTVERKEGRFTAPSGRVLQVVDLPGAYSLDAASPDEAITRDICTGTFPGESAPDLIVCVADAMRDQSLAANIGTFEQYATVYSGMDIERFIDPPVTREEVREQLGLAPQHIATGPGQEQANQRIQRHGIQHGDALCGCAPIWGQQRDQLHDRDKQCQPQPKAH